MTYPMCEKCKDVKGEHCVYYSQYESYLCGPCYKIWLKIDKTFKNQNYKLIESNYLEWLKQKG